MIKYIDGTYDSSGVCDDQGALLAVLVVRHEAVVRAGHFQSQRAVLVHVLEGWMDGWMDMEMEIIINITKMPLLVEVLASPHPHQATTNILGGLMSNTKKQEQLLLTHCNIRHYQHTVILDIINTL